MQDVASEPMQALLARFQEVVGAEEGRCRSADLNVEEIEAALRRARDVQRAAAERLSQAVETFDAVAAYAASQASGDLSKNADAAPSGASGSSGRLVPDLIVDVLELGQATPLLAIYDRVRRLRPGTTNSAIRGALSVLRKTGVVELVSRSLYRLVAIPEDYQPQS
ncbi:MULTISPECIES: hypothetical protein [Streptomyces]|uniref:hypothetical protein n=1 Tax=Streptomyces TaxID=1883 RepID=UPI00056544B0|nr:MULTISPECIES: hypothetical protein [Streptomyces]MBZ6111161.1 hypothetical protein [Streptomyces olivaceus]MBZ6127721.1 hypothetical protein [Streptomyces olivaceus]MBZ6145497.1 hypothetical protein [Streptomyces olivaceus]MBZ6159497.1 hypothetical protein [Streptomyces olivaceus]MBZ6187274.1 hypothetical protein [Streptomyces olivaceus]